MDKENVNDQFAKMLAIKAGISVAQSKRIIQAMWITMTELFLLGHEIQFKNFGKFMFKLSRPFHSHLTDDDIKMRVRIVFKPAKMLKDLLNKTDDEKKRAIEIIRKTYDNEY